MPKEEVIDTDDISAVFLRLSYKVERFFNLGYLIKELLFFKKTTI